MYNHTEDVHNSTSPSIILPKVFKLFSPSSILDIGCGIGTWLSVAKRLGTRDVLGVDGDYVNKSLLAKYLTEGEFVSHDLTIPLNLGRKFELCLCLEVAEHLPENTADVLINSLAGHSDVILFSAAIPGQGGQNHLNEKWPSFWIDKFSQLGYKVYDPIRPLIWDDQRVDPWYRQNILLFTKGTFSLTEPLFRDIVLPDFFQKKVSKNQLLEHKLNLLIEGKYGAIFYLKRFFLSIFKFGGKRIC